MNCIKLLILNCDHQNHDSPCYILTILPRTTTSYKSIESHTKHFWWSWLKICWMRAPVGQKIPQADWNCCLDSPAKEISGTECLTQGTECLTEGAASSKSNCKPCPILCHDVGWSKKVVALQDKYSEGYNQAQRLFTISENKETTSLIFMSVFYIKSFTIWLNKKIDQICQIRVSWMSVNFLNYYWQVDFPSSKKHLMLFSTNVEHVEFTEVWIKVSVTLTVHAP